jgi:hypothetical protein
MNLEYVYSEIYKQYCTSGGVDVANFFTEGISMKTLQKKTLMILIAVMVTCSVFLSSCKSGDKAKTAESSGIAVTESNIAVNESNTASVKNLSQDVEKLLEGATAIDLNNSERTVEITQPGTYHFTGTSEDTQIYVEYQGDLNFIFDNTNITSKENSVLNVVNGDISLYLIGENTFTDTDNYVFGTDAEGNPETEPDAVIFCKDDIAVGGTGTLNINANYKDGIGSKNKLSIESGTLNIISADDGIRGKDSVTILGGTLNITSKGDGIKSTNTTDAGLGNIVINDGNIMINSESDGIQGVNLLQINGGTVNVTDCSEGLESTVIEINGGDVSINATDDGVNASDKRTDTETTSADNKFGGGDMAVIEGVSLTIKGGNVNVKGGADGLDSNGIITITGGDIHATGMMSSGIGEISIDSNGAVTVTGGNIWSNDIQIVKDGELVENEIGWTLTDNVLSSGGFGGGMGGFGGGGRMPQDGTMPNGESFTPPTGGTMPNGEEWGGGFPPTGGTMPNGESFTPPTGGTMPNGETWDRTGTGFGRGNRPSSTTSETVTVAA